MTIAYRPADAARELGISRRQVSRLIASGALVARKAGARTLVDATSLQAYFESLPVIGSKSRVVAHEESRRTPIAVGRPHARRG
jgi:excisionase family DNA binding protein